MAVTEIFAKACKIEVPTTGLVSDAGDDDDVPGNPVGVSLISKNPDMTGFALGRAKISGDH